MKIMSKYSERLTAKIVSLIERDTFTLSEICDALNISRKTFYDWMDTHDEFRTAVEAAEERRDESLAMLARRSLKQKLEGYTLSETRTIYIPDETSPEKREVKMEIVKVRQYPPDTGTIRLVLEQEYRRRKDKVQKKEGTGATTETGRLIPEIRIVENREDAQKISDEKVKTVKEIDKS